MVKRVTRRVHRKRRTTRRQRGGGYQKTVGELKKYLEENNIPDTHTVHAYGVPSGPANNFSHYENIFKVTSYGY